MANNPLQIGQTVYHQDLYNDREHFKVVGITEDKVLLEGDFSGGTNNVTQRDWMPIKGVTRVYDHAYKEGVRKSANAIMALSIPCADSKDRTYLAMIDMVNAVLHLTQDIPWNPRFT